MVKLENKLVKKVLLSNVYELIKVEKMFTTYFFNFFFYLNSGKIFIDFFFRCAIIFNVSRSKVQLVLIMIISPIYLLFLNCLYKFIDVNY